MQKQQRQKIILKLIEDKQISRQEELAGLLEDEGFTVTQSSVSRDLLDLGIIKLNGAYALPQMPKNTVASGLLGLETAGENLIVAKTVSGLASAVAVRIDDQNFDEIVGTVAGDDTIFIAVRGQKGQKAVLKKVWEIFEN